MPEQSRKKLHIGIITTGLLLLVITMLITSSYAQTSDQPDKPQATKTLRASNTPTTTPSPTHTIPAEPFGLEIRFDYERDEIEDEITESYFRDIVQFEWIAPAIARYEVLFYFDTTGFRKYCGLTEAILYYQGIDLTLSVTDTSDNETLLVSPILSAQLPDECPEDYDFEIVDGQAQQAIEWILPAANEIDMWLNANVSILASMPSTPTSTITRTPTPTNTHTLTPTPTITSTPVENSSLLFTGTVVIRDENGEAIGTESEGEYQLVGILQENYIIIYKGERAYVLTSSHNATPGRSGQTTQP